MVNFAGAKVNSVTSSKLVVNSVIFQDFDSDLSPQACGRSKYVTSRRDSTQICQAHEAAACKGQGKLLLEVQAGWVAGDREVQGWDQG